MQKRHRIEIGALLLAVTLTLSGCAARTVHPGAANSFDSSTYDTLIIAHSVIESTKADLAANSFPASIAGNVKSALNGLIRAYNVADTAYQAYHNAAIAGTATVVQSNAVTNAVNDVNAQTAALAAAKKGQ